MDEEWCLRAPPQVVPLIVDRVQGAGRDADRARFEVVVFRDKRVWDRRLEEAEPPRTRWAVGAPVRVCVVDDLPPVEVVACLIRGQPLRRARLDVVAEEELMSGEVGEPLVVFRDLVSAEVDADGNDVTPHVCRREGPGEVRKRTAGKGGNHLACARYGPRGTCITGVVPHPKRDVHARL